LGGSYGALASLCCYCVHEKGTADRKRTVDGIKVVCMLGMGEKSNWVGNLGSQRAAKRRFWAAWVGYQAPGRRNETVSAATHEQSARVQFA
jgi:hypothetical protein